MARRARIRVKAAPRISERLASARAYITNGLRNGSLGGALAAGFDPSSALEASCGAPGRLDFTVIGEAVNAAARIASLCRTLDESTLVSRRFAETTERSFRVCGNHSLRGMVEPLELLAPNVNGART